jgi:DNA-binding IscR family transcriptional regulator
MRLTQEIDYAFRTVSYLMKYPEEVIGASVIAEEMHRPL